jgi:hypothetical protein
MTRAISAGLPIVVGLRCSAPPAANTPVRLPLRHLAMLYGKYRGSHKGQQPKDEAQLKQFIAALDGSQLSAAGISAAEIDTLFVSPRDGRPHDVRYNDSPPPDGPNGPSAVVIEKVGKDGMCFVAYSTAKVEEIDDAQF